MSWKELFEARGWKSRVFLGLAAALLAGIAECLLLSMFFWGGVRSADVRRNPLLVQPLAEIPTHAQKLLLWRAHRVRSSYRISLREGTLTGGPETEASDAKGVEFEWYASLPSEGARLFLKPLDSLGWIRILESPSSENGYVGQILVQSLYKWGSPCVFEVYFASP
jgi:hypothetical protein